jgi:hypothetical protein
MNERTFQAAVKYGGIALAICIILNIWVVMRHVEIYRAKSRADIQFQQLATQQQVFQGLLQEFAARASSDAEIASIFKKAQTMNSAPGAASTLSNQPLQPTVPTR